MRFAIRDPYLNRTLAVVVDRVYRHAQSTNQSPLVIAHIHPSVMIAGYDSGGVLVNIFKETWKADDLWTTYRQLPGRCEPS
jgi:hypothetical protein